ncbi:MAG: phage Gp37/Gp68 family protein [Pseudomonadota bacterium]
MAANSKIEWTTHTFNPWWGCLKVSPACKHCYAEAWSRRTGQRVWGANAPRRFFGDKHWAQPLKWNKEALYAGLRPRVFCASMADVFEDRPDLDVWRERLWTLIADTQALDWLLLTKRPELVTAKVPWVDQWPRNVWLGTTVENKHWAERRLPEIARVPARVRFISAEPLLGPVNLRPWSATIHWVIAGGESGPKARPSSPSWFRGLQDQCVAANIPFHFKQWGDWKPVLGRYSGTSRSARTADGTTMVRVGRKIAGRQLDGVTWDGLPQTVD